MNQGPRFFFALFFVLAFSFGGLVLGTQMQLGTLAPHYDDLEGKAFPERTPGSAAQGALVYRDLGCASCHTQQVRRPDVGGDKARGWGDRQSVARDYVHQATPQLGASRIGPDLANFGSRAEKDGLGVPALLAKLYNGHGAMPSYRFLFEERQVIGQPAALALKSSVSGREIVPSSRATALAAYLLSMKQVYEYPEARPYQPAPGPEASPQ